MWKVNVRSFYFRTEGMRCEEEKNRSIKKWTDPSKSIFLIWKGPLISLIIIESYCKKGEKN